MLLHLLKSLNTLLTDDLFVYDVVVVDNDAAESGRPVIESLRGESTFQISYFSEPTQNIALARNMAVTNATGHYLALIDDDEYPRPSWLLTLYQACRRYNAAGVLGPVVPDFQETPPDWILKGHFYRKGDATTGTVLSWKDTRTSNVLLDRSIFDHIDNRFNPALGRGGEDVDFFQRMIEKNYKFLWCNEAFVFETIPPERCKISFMLKRAIHRGRLTVNYKDFNFSYIVRSLIAVPVYTAFLPLAYLVGLHVAIAILLKDAEHLGRLFGLLGIDPIREYYLSK